MPEPRWVGEHTLEVQCCPGDKVVTASQALHRPWGGWAFLPRHMLNSRVGGGISPIIYFLSLHFYNSCFLL